MQAQVCANNHVHVSDQLREVQVIILNEKVGPIKKICNFKAREVFMHSVAMFCLQTWHQWQKFNTDVQASLASIILVTTMRSFITYKNVDCIGLANEQKVWTEH